MIYTSILSEFLLSFFLLFYFKIEGVEFYIFWDIFIMSYHVTFWVIFTRVNYHFPRSDMIPHIHWYDNWPTSLNDTLIHSEWTLSCYLQSSFRLESRSYDRITSGYGLTFSWDESSFFLHPSYGTSLNDSPGWRGLCDAAVATWCFRLFSECCMPRNGFMFVLQ